jgi:hypothetical protein
VISKLSNQKKGILFSLAALQSYQDPKDLLKPRNGTYSLAPINPFLRSKEHAPTLIEVLGAQAYVVSSADDVIVVCRGTEATSINDTLADLKIVSVYHRNGGLVHSGFYTEYSKVAHGIQDAIKSHNPVGLKKVWITGHSLGGAMAVLLSMDIKPAGCYTFGQPRVGNKKLMKQIDFPYYRYKNNNDIVTNVPFVILGYCHGGILRYIDVNGNMRQSTVRQRMGDILRGFWIAAKHGEWFDGLYDHRMLSYYDYLIKMDTSGQQLDQ